MVGRPQACKLIRQRRRMMITACDGTSVDSCLQVRTKRLTRKALLDDGRHKTIFYTDHIVLQRLSN